MVWFEENIKDFSANNRLSRAHCIDVIVSYLLDPIFARREFFLSSFKMRMFVTRCVFF